MIAFNIALIIQIFALLNPLASFPFLMNAYKKKMNLKVIAVKAVITAFVIALIITLIGPFLLNIFGISLNSLRIAGGAVLFLLGINMIIPPAEEKGDVSRIESVTTIIATPLLTGPATISFITVKAYEIGKFAVLFNLCWAFLLVAIVFALFSFAVNRINIKIVDIASRVMGLFLTAVAIEMIAKGVQGIITAAL